MARGSFSEGNELKERVVDINRVAKVVKGGRRFSFTALVVVGDENGHVGAGYGKAREVPLAIQKAIEDAKKNLFTVPRYNGTTTTHQVIGRFGAARVLLKPASPGTGVIAAGGVRAVLELAGVRDILTKSLGTTNPINLVRATVAGLQSLKTPEGQARLRGISVSKVLGLDQREEAADETVAALRPGRPQKHDDLSGDHAGQERDRPAPEPSRHAARARTQAHPSHRGARGHPRDPRHGEQGRVSRRGTPGNEEVVTWLN